MVSIMSQPSNTTYKVVNEPELMAIPESMAIHLYNNDIIDMCVTRERCPRLPQRIKRSLINGVRQGHA